MSQITSLLEQARQYAVANNTYTWAAFYEDKASSDGTTIYMTVMSSKDGTDPTEGFSVSGQVPSNKITPLHRSVSFPQVMLKTSGANTWASLPKVTSPSDLSDDVSFGVRLPGKGDVMFNQIVQFSPAGEARVAAGIPNVIEMGLRPLSGKTLEEENNIAVIRITGMTGQTRLYRP